MSKLISYHQKRPLIVFGEDWGAHPSSTQHLIKALEMSRTIIWINSIGLRAPKCTKLDIRRVYEKIKLLAFAHNEVENTTPEERKNFIVINPIVIPCATSWVTLTLSKLILKFQLHFACRKLSIEEPIIWTSLPTSVDYLELFNDAPCVYYCGDDFSNLAGVDHKHVANKESELIEKATYIFTASDQLNSKFPANKVVNIPHGVDFQLFSNRVSPVPDDLPKGKPIAGFYGSISTWLDQDLMVETINAMPEWNFVFIGKVACDITKLSVFSNVYFIGPKSHLELPGYIQNWSVAMLPFINNKQVQMCNPLKLREYLASGTPIATTNFNALDGYREYFQVVNSNKPFYKAILLAHAEIAPNLDFNKINTIQKLLALTQKKELRKSCVIAESWECRASYLDKYLALC